MINHTQLICTIKKFNIVIYLLAIFASFSIIATQSSPIEKHGFLSVYNGKIVDQNQQAVSLAGPSFFWSNNGFEGERFYNAQTVTAFATDWNASLVRAAMAAQNPGSYLTHPDDNQKKVEAVVDAAIDNNIYVIIDWHSHQAENNINEAIHFFEKMAKRYKNYPNIIYEIYNEPLNSTDWATVIKPYAEKVIHAIRNIDKKNLILVGTQTWSQDVDKAAKNPITNNKNIAYSLHFYAGTHKSDLRKKAQQAINAGLALFVSEWGTVNANGDGGIDRVSTELWLKFMKENQLSFSTWSVTNKDESSAILKPSTQSLGPWQNKQLTTNGLYLKNIIKNWAK